MNINFVIGEIRIPLKAGLEFTQTYEPIGGTSTLRTQSGKAIKQTHFNKLKTVLSGRGWVPAGLDGLDYSQPLLLKCVAPRSISSLNSSITIPTARRSDTGFEPIGYVLVGGELIQTSLNLSADIATLDPIPGAISYQVQYYPEIMVFAGPPQIQNNVYGAEFSWTLTCEEV